MSVLVDVAELSEAMRRPSPPVLLDVRWALGDPDGHAHYLDGHIPGDPLPDPAELQASARRWGVSTGSSVVAYDDVGGTSAARAWWLLRWAGMRDVRLLDGGLGAWQAAGLAIEAGEVRPAPGDVTAMPGAMPTVDADGAARTGRDGVLLDARAAARYRGDEEPVDPVAGHIPGAVSAPTADNLTGSGEFLDRGALRERFAGLGVTGEADVAVYCGSGVTAAHEVAALAQIGVEAALYPGSWSQWCNDAARPVETGAAPS